MSNENVITQATYLAEDNKLRFYVSERLSEDLYQRAKAIGFVYAPKQHLYVAPKWTVEREDFLLEFVDEIVAEGTTIAERALAKIERLNALSEKRANEANSFQIAAIELQNRTSCQPALLGHHSYKKAMRNQDKIDRAESKASELVSTSNYWIDRAIGCERFANMKNNWSTRIGRIDNLLKELRSVQSSTNHAYVCKKLWTKISGYSDNDAQKKAVDYYLGEHLKTGRTCSYSLYSIYDKGEIDHKEALDRAIVEADFVINSSKNARILNHILNRLNYEREMLGAVSPYKGKITATILKAFARQQGCHKPECKLIDDQWELSSFVPLPLHLNPKCLQWLTLSDDGWVKLMQQCGYTVPAEKPKAPPTLNFQAKAIKVNLHNSIKNCEQITLTKSEYQEIYKDYRAIKLSQCGQFKVRICRNPKEAGAFYDKSWVCVFLSDSKKHPAIISDAISFEKEEVAA